MRWLSNMIYIYAYDMDFSFMLMDIVLWVPLWTDLRRGHIVGLIYVSALTVGGVVGVSTTVEREKWGCYDTTA